MTDKELLRVVTGFRKGILGKSSPLKMCWKICLPLSGYLIALGVNNKVTEGTVNLCGFNKGVKIGHFWITLSDGRIIDPTASQFNGWGCKDMPDVYLGAKPEYYTLKRKRKQK